MPFNSSLPEWNKTATAPAQSKKDAGWGANEKPPASIFNWFFNTAYLALQELQQEAINVDQKGVNNGVATLDATGDLPIGQADNILNWIKGFGVGDVGKAATDANALDATGFYSFTTASPSNLPLNNGTFFNVLNIKLSATARNQMAINISTGDVWTRKQLTSTWSAWQQQATQDWVKSFGLGGLSSNYTGDLNSLSTNGLYFAQTAATNKPTSDNGYVLVQAYSTTYISQTFVNHITGVMSQRVNYNGTWTNWSQVATIDSNGLLTPSTEVKANSILSLGSNQIRKSLGAFIVANGVANTKADITIPNASMHAVIDITVVGQWNYANATGKLTKRYILATTVGGTISYQKSGYIEAEGNLVNHISLGDIVWDSTNSVFKIQIASNTTNGNNFDVSAKVIGTSSTYLTYLKQMTMGATYTTDTTVLPTPVLSNGMTDWVKSFGLGDVAKDISSTDLNNLDASGFYRGNNLTNGPLSASANQYYFVINLKHSSTFKTQMAISFNTGSNLVYTRVLNNGSWTSWVQTAQYDATGKVATANLPAATTSAAGIAQLVDSISSTATDKAATANSVKLLQDWAKGFGIGTVGPTITDANAVTNTGFYAIAGGTGVNVPNTNGGTLIHINRDNAKNSQLYFDVTASGGFYFRTATAAGTWGAWKQLATTDLGTTSAPGLLQLVDSITSTDVTKAATANSVKLALDWVKGFGVGTNSVMKTDPDLNALTTNGFYYIYGTNKLNAPSTASGYLVVETIDSSNTKQTYHTINGTGTWVRVKDTGVWKAWTQLATYDASGKIATANLPSSVPLLSANNQLSVANQSNISAIKSDAVSLTSGVDTKLTSFTTEYRDVQNEFDPTLGEVTVKESGVYVIECQVALTATYSGNTYVKVYKGGAAYVNITAATTQQLLYGTVLAQLAAGDKLTFYVVQNSGSTGSLSSAKIEMTKIS